MPGMMYHANAAASCPHAGQISVIPTNTRVLVSGQPVAILADTYPIAGCPFQIPTPAGPKPQPCVTARWLMPATRVLIHGSPVILQTSTGICSSPEQIPQGSPVITATQTRVMAS